MALLFIDGFDHYATADLTAKWSSLGGTVVVSAGNGRHGSNAVRLTTSGATLQKACGTANTTVVVGMAVRSPLTQGTNATFLFLRDSAGTRDHLLLTAGSSGAMVVYRGGNTLTAGSNFSGTVLGTTSSGLSANTYAYVELQAVLASGTGGSVTVRLNGVSVLTVTGITTQNTNGAAGWSGIGLASSVDGSGQYDVDDLYVLDGSGAAPWNTFLGDCRVDARYPTGAGATTGWTPSTGANWSCVDETAPNGDTDYVSAATSGLTDTYVTQDAVVIGAPIYGVQHALSMKKSDTGTCTVAPVIRVSGVDYPGADLAPSTAYGYGLQIAQTNPATAAQWTEAGFNAAEFGMKRTA